jgi:hypothetical protein
MLTLGAAGFDFATWLAPGLMSLWRSVAYREQPTGPLGFRQIAESLGEHTSASLGSGTNIWFRSHMTREQWLICGAPDVTLCDWKTHLNSRSLEDTENRVSVPNAVKFNLEGSLSL